HLSSPAALTTCGTLPYRPGSMQACRTEVAEWAGHSVGVLLRVYAKCITGQHEVAIRWRATVQNGPKAVRVDQCYRTERMLRCLDLGTIASEDLCSAGGPSSGRLSEAS